MGGHDEKEQTLNQLLAELDGFDSTSGLVLLGATNRPEILDPALLRAGRFDRQILVDRPDKTGRIQILRVHLKKIKLGDDINVDQIAALTPGFSGADLANLVNEAAILATRRRHDAVMLEDFTGAIERMIAGLEKKNRLINPKEREIVAWHEMGHALVSLALPGAETVHKVSIIPRGIGSLGYTINRPTEDRYLMTQPELENKMAVLLGGRAAEALHFREVTTGASDDLVRATEIARSMVTRYGMSKKLGQIAYETTRNVFLAQAGEIQQENRNYSDETARDIDDEVRQLIREAFEKATSILTEKVDALQTGAKALLDQETLSEDEVIAILRGNSSDCWLMTRMPNRNRRFQRTRPMTTVELKNRREATIETDRKVGTVFYGKRIVAPVQETISTKSGKRNDVRSLFLSWKEKKRLLKNTVPIHFSNAIPVRIPFHFFRAMLK